MASGEQRAVALRDEATVVPETRRARHRSPFTVHCSPFTVPRSPCAVHRSPFTVHRSPFTVHPSPFTVSRPPLAGFTLIELLVVLAVIALLLTIAVPRYFHSVDRAREAVLREDLSQMRRAIDQHFADRGAYPAQLEDLVERKYLRRIPQDPITESAASWIALPPPAPAEGGVYDVRSGAEGKALDGTAYADW